MKFKLDENLPAEIAQDLRAAGHEADTVPDEGLAGAPDSQLLAATQREGRALLTMDKGIADVRAYPPKAHHGIVLFRLHATGRQTTLAFVRQHIPAILAIELEGRLLIVSENGIRIR